MKSCLEFTYSYRKLLQLTVLSVSLKTIALITNSDYCSQKFKEHLVDEVSKISEKGNYNFDISQHEMSKDPNDNKALNEFFYGLKVIGVSFIIVTVLQEDLPKVFTIANRYSLLEGSVIWFIPYYKKDVLLDNTPKQILTFHGIESNGQNIYTNASLLIDQVLNIYEENRTSFHLKR